MSLKEVFVSLQARFSNVGGYGKDDRASSIRGVMINLHSDDEKLDLHMNTGTTGVFENLITIGMVRQANRGTTYWNSCKIIVPIWELHIFNPIPPTSSSIAEPFLPPYFHVQVQSSCLLHMLINFINFSNRRGKH